MSEPLRYTLYAVDGTGEPQLQSVEVVDKGGKKLWAAERVSAFRFRARLERGKFARSPQEAWYIFAEEKRQEVKDLEQH